MNKYLKALMLFMALMTLFVIAGCSGGEDKTEAPAEKLKQQQHQLNKVNIVLLQVQLSLRKF